MNPQQRRAGGAAPENGDNVQAHSAREHAATGEQRHVVAQAGRRADTLESALVREPWLARLRHAWRRMRGVDDSPVK